MNDANCVGENWAESGICTVSHYAEQTQDKLVPLNLAGGAARLITMAVPATVYKHCSVARQRLTQSFQTPTYCTLHKHIVRLHINETIARLHKHVSAAKD